MHNNDSGPATRARRSRKGGSSVPMCRTMARRSSSGTPIALAISIPLLEMKRVNDAAATFSASRLFVAMSQRWAVMLHGMPDTRDAIQAIDAEVAAQWAWM